MTFDIIMAVVMTSLLFIILSVTFTYVRHGKATFRGTVCYALLILDLLRHWALYASGAIMGFSLSFTALHHLGFLDLPNAHQLIPPAIVAMVALLILRPAKWATQIHPETFEAVENPHTEA